MERIYFNVINWLTNFLLLLKTPLKCCIFKMGKYWPCQPQLWCFWLSKGYQNCRNALAGVVEGPCHVVLLKHIASFISTSSIHFHGGVRSPKLPVDWDGCPCMLNDSPSVITHFHQTPGPVWQQAVTLKWKHERSLTRSHLPVSFFRLACSLSLYSVLGIVGQGQGCISPLSYIHCPKDLLSFITLFWKSSPCNTHKSIEETSEL